jgi:hypothetical protein
MRRDCWIQSANILRELEAFFSEVDDDVSSFYEENPTSSEPNLDGMLVKSLTSKSFERYANRINAERQRTGQRPVTLSIKSTPISSQERKHGADLGIVARLNIPGEHEITKAALVQSKRLYPNLIGFDEDCVYPEIFKENTRVKVESQWKRMLDLTPSSFYFLYNPEKIRVKRTIKPVKTRVMTALNIAGRASGRRVLTVEDALNATTFADWMVDEFICCNVGDPREQVVAAALGNNPDFTVRHSIEVTIEREQASPQGFLDSEVL